MERKKLLVRVIMIIVVVLAIFSVSILRMRNVDMDEEKQIKLFSDKVTEWNAKYLSSAYPYYITIADLNQDGRLELITATIEGTGKYSQNNYYVIEEETAELIQLQENTAERMNSPDIIYDVMYKEKELVDISVYYDTKKNMYYSIYKDYCRVTSQKSTEAIVGLTINNDEIKEQYLAYKLLEYNTEGDGMTISYWDYDQNELSKEEYEKIEECTFSDMQEMKMTWKWQKVTGNQMENMDRDKIYVLLKDLYDSFKIV